MALVNFPNVRIKKYDLGYVVEMQKTTWYGRRYWTHIVSVAGMDDEPWYYKKYNTALEDAVKLFKWHMISC
jgi:hypothetical protein